MWLPPVPPPHKGQHHICVHLQEGAKPGTLQEAPAHDPRGWNLAIPATLEAWERSSLSISEHPALLSSPPEPKIRGWMGWERPRAVRSTVPRH